MNFKLTFTNNKGIMEKYGSTQGRSISTNKIVEFIKPLISIVFMCLKNFKIHS